jgi:ribosomal protein S18 acetylase RimI-like enzyme
MPAGVVLRSATRKDAAELAVLVDIASHGLANWLWHGAVIDGRTDTALERGRQRMLDEKLPGGWKCAVMAERHGEVAGAVIAYRLEESVAEAVAPHPVIEPLMDLQREAIGSWYIDSLGVYRAHRRQGVGRKLLEDQLARTEADTSLITESDNDTAKALYRSEGFVEIKRRQAVPLYENSKRHDWILMIRTAAGSKS